jgi:hypothetical protein
VTLAGGGALAGSSGVAIIKIEFAVFGLWLGRSFSETLLSFVQIVTEMNSSPDCNSIVGSIAQSSTVIRSIQVVDFKERQPAVRSKVDDVVAQTSEEDLQSLRKSIDATPEAASALKAKGLSSLQVVAINIADGVLTLITKTA